MSKKRRQWDMTVQFRNRRKERRLRERNRERKRGRETNR